MKIQFSKSLLIIATFISLLFVAAGLEAKKGGGGKPDKPGHTDGEAAALNCELVTDPFDTVRNDGLGAYQDGGDKVACGHGGTVQPNLSGIGLNTVSKGAIKRAIRKIDLAFGDCVGPDGVSECEYIPEEFLSQADSVEDMEDVWIGTGPYPDDPEMTHIQLMDPGVYEMKSHIVPLGFADRYVIQLMNREVFPTELSQGQWCKLEENPDFGWEDTQPSQDMTVYIWPDGNDNNSLPDGYTITTGTIGDTSTMPPEVIPGPRTGTICSAAGPYPCDGDLCNLLGTVPVQLTLHATYQ